MSDILQEIAQDISDEKAKKIFMNLLPKVFLATLFIALFFVAKNYFESNEQKKKMLFGDRYVNIILANNSDKNIADLEDIISSSGYKGLSQLSLITKAKFFVDSLKFNEAQNIYELIISDNSNDQIIINFARIRWVMLELNKPQSLINSNKIDEMTRVFLDKNADLFGMGSCFRAVWLIKFKRYDEAKKLLEAAIKSDNVPEVLKRSLYAIMTDLN